MQIRFATWMLRVIWLLQPLAFAPLVNDATSTLSSLGRLIVLIVLWALWAALLLATLVPSTVSLTAGRVIAPMAVVAALAAAAFASVEGWKIAAAIVATVVAGLVWFSGEIGLGFVQGSAYGNEQRFPLKPPIPTIVPIVVSWLVVTFAFEGGVLLLANRRWIVGVALLLLTALVGWFLAPRFHQLSRRWFVVVPVGVVIHDPLVLSDVNLFRSSVLERIRLAPADTEAADLTGGTAGVPIEIVFNEMQTVVKAGGRERPSGTALHALSVLVSPTRPGRALATAADGRLPVG